jgi:hypothetical protein
MFDILFFWTSFYSLGSWMSLTTKERGDFRRAVELAAQEATT